MIEPKRKNIYKFPDLKKIFDFIHENGMRIRNVFLLFLSFDFFVSIIIIVNNNVKIIF